ncbi:MAG TPA: DNA mismatch repair endonuclease MutL [Acetobacteraceae bacterium]|nr:DNA mismatch repair endonuclease MutL [Acetobacteraceae bacterium]
MPETTVNRIAAGEVIERPAAAVKELVENALDAGARRISIALVGGGIDRIEVTDDGSGMTAEELGLCVLRHATSKLNDDTLIRIDTLGFRGEALPSIGAAARLEVTSRPRGSEGGHANAITVEGGVVGQVVPAAGAPGTRIVVRDLFFATPARRKFLKHPRTEAEHAEAVVRRLAMAAPDTAFRLENEGRVIFDLPAQERAPRVAALLGTEAAASMLPVREVRAVARGGPARQGQPASEGQVAGQDDSRGEMVLSGYLCAPTISRMTAAAQGLVVNGRPVADPVLKTAVRVAYRDVIAHGRHPVVALWLDLPPEELDVNVHPAKTELRFRDPAAVRSLVIGALSRVLAGAAGTDMPGPGLMQHRPALNLAWSRPPARGGIRALPLPGFPREAAPPPPGMSETVLTPAYGPNASWHTSPGTPGDTGFPGSSGSDAGSPSGALDFVAPPVARTVQVPGSAQDYPLGAAVAQVLDTYIIAVAADGTLILVDQHAAHERLTHEAIRTRMLDGGASGQPLLLPAVVDLPEADASRLLARAIDLAQLGLEIESFGPGAVLVRALPVALGAPEPAPLIRDIADELAELDETMALSARLDAVIARMACHGSIRAGRRLGQAEMDALLRQMEATPRAATCSHGRPTFLRLSKAEIETLFGRR